MAGVGDCACQEDWRRLFWLVSARRGERRNLRTDVEGREADALVIWFVVAWGDASAVSVEGVKCAGGVDQVDSLERLAVAVAGVGIEGVGADGGLEGVAVAVAVADIGVEEAGDVEDAGVVARIAVAGVDVVDGVRAFAGDGVGAEVGGVHRVLNGRERAALCRQSKVSNKWRECVRVNVMG